MPESREVDSNNVEGSPPPESPPSTPADGAGQSNRAEPFPRIGVRHWLLVLAVGILVWAVVNAFDPFGRYAYPQAQIDELSYPYPIHLVIADVADNSKIYTLDLMMYSRSYSAQYPIKLEVISLRQISGEAEKADLHIVFPHSDYPPPREDKPEQLGYYGGASLHLAAPTNLTWYNSTGSFGGRDIQYAMQGCYNIVLTSNRDYFRDHDTFEYDCTQMNIAYLEATASLKNRDAQAEITNATLRLATNTLRVNDLLYALTAISVTTGLVALFQSRKTRQT